MQRQFATVTVVASPPLPGTVLNCELVQRFPHSDLLPNLLFRIERTNVGVYSRRLRQALRAPAVFVVEKRVS